ncbi:MAG: CotH kinase family protein, partial [Ruminococcus sp.]|nr:CotH kinase family protein [Ruminococcus sp.]
FDVDAPLCSYVYITVNGEDWGLYLAVEAIEDSFLERNYGSNYGDLYKPDAMSFGGGRGNGKDFSMGNFMNKESDEKDKDSSDDTKEKSDSFNPQDFGGGMPDFGNMPDFGGDMPQFDSDNMPEDFGDFDPSKMFGGEGEKQGFGGGEGKGGFGGGFGMGSDDVKLKYTDDDIDSYSNIFNNAKTPVDKADKKRLISSLKALSEQSDLESTLDVEEVIRYFVVHDFLVNGDSYTGQMIHNYYLYEEDGQLSMIPWDYNLAYGSFMGGTASSSINSPIDTPVSNGMSDRPMVSWIFDNEEYTEQYHKLFSEFIDSVDFEKLVADTAELIDKYVEKDPTKFCTYDDFKTGVEAISKFCTLREESVSGQLNGTIPSTTEGQNADSSALIDADGLNTSDMGSMGGGFGGGQRGGFSRTDRAEKSESADASKTFGEGKIMQTSNTSGLSVKMLSNIQLLANEDSSDSSSSKRGGRGGFSGGQPPQGFGGEMPEGFDPNNMPEGFSPFGGAEKSDFKSGNNTDEDKVTETDKPADSDEKSNAHAADDGSAAPENESGRSSDGEMPGMGRFFQMGSSAQANNTVAYVLLGVSAVILLLGLGVALKFRR